MHPGTGFARNTLLNENICLVCCFLWLHTIYQFSFAFYKIYLLGWPLGEYSPPENIGVPDSKDHQTLLVPTEVCNVDWGVLMAFTAVTVLWHPWVGLTKELVEGSEISSDYLFKDHCWGLLALVLTVKLTAVQYITPAPSCCKENIFGECYLYPEGTAFMIGKDQPVGGAWTGPTRCGRLWLASKYIIIF